MSKEYWAMAQGSVPELYQRYMAPAIFEPWGEELLKLARVQPRERVLDVACGTGVVSRQVCAGLRERGSVVGIDISRAMVELARSISPTDIEFREGNATELPFTDGSFDLVVCQQGLQFFPDRLQAMREMHRVLEKRGRIALAVFCASPGHSALAEAVTPYVGAEAAAFSLDPLSFPDPIALRTLVLEAGFADVQMTRRTKPTRFRSPDEFLAYTMGTRLSNAVAALSADDQQLMLKSARSALEPFCTSEGLAMPMHAHLLCALRTS